jgi:hypothetical protein
MSDPLLKIKNMKQMSKQIGRDIARDMALPLDELKHLIRPKEVISLIKQYSVYKNDEYLINTMILNKIFYETKNWILGIQLAKMASEGKLDTFWDDESNCMTFSSSDTKESKK